MAERDTRAMVSAGWWPGTPPQQRQNLVAGRMLALPDGSWWLFGAWGRWYRWTRADGQWHLCPPPQLSITRMSARPLQQGMPVPPVPPHVVPTGPDLAYDPPAPLAFVDAGVRPEVTSRVRATVESAAALPTPDYPHWWGLFSPSVPSAVPVTWGVMLWCATAPVFDSRIDAQLLGLWSAHRARPLPDIDGPRWLTPPPLESLIGLYTERLRAGRVDSAVVILRTMWAIAGALREDVRFQPRADALIAMLGVTLQNPTVDYGALSYGDRAVVQQWLTRCPPALAPALRVEASAGEHFRNTYYDLATALAPVAGEPSERGYVEPRLIAAALLSADLSVVRQDVSNQVIGWLDPQVGEVMRAMLIQRDHPLRPFWPESDRLPRSLRERMDTAGPTVRNTLLATMYGADLAWCRLGGGIPARPRGFPSSVAILAEIVGPRRATSAASTEPGASPAPGIAPLAHQYPANPSTPGAAPGVAMAQEPPTGPPGQAPAWASPSGTPAPPATEAWDGSTPWPTTGERDPGTPAAPPATEAWSGAEGLDAPGPKSHPPTQAWHGTGENAPGTPMPPPATQAWSGTGESVPGAPMPPPATQAWSGTGENASGAPMPPPATQAWSGTGENLPGTPKPPPATQAWPGTGEREVGGAAASPPATEAWSGSEGPDTARPKPPPATQAWPGTGANEAGGTASPPPAAQAWPGTESRDAGGAGPRPSDEARFGTEGLDTGRPKPPPPTQAWPGTGESEVGTAPAVSSAPPATQAWPGGGSGDAGSPPPGGAWPGSAAGSTGGAGSQAPAGEAWPGSGAVSAGGAGSEVSAEARLGAEGLDEGEPKPPPSAPASSGTGEVGGAEASRPPDAQASAEAEGRDPGGAGSSPPDSVAWLGAEGLDSGGPKPPASAHSWPGTDDREQDASASDEARPDSNESGGAGGAGGASGTDAIGSAGGMGGASGADALGDVDGAGSADAVGGADGAGSPDAVGGAGGADAIGSADGAGDADSLPSGVEGSSADEESDEGEGSATRAWTEAERLEALSASPSGTEAWSVTGEQATGDSAVPPETRARPGAENAEDAEVGGVTPPTATAWSSAEGIERDEAASVSRPSIESAPPAATSSGTESSEAGSPLPSPTAQAWDGVSGDTPLAVGDGAEVADDRTVADLSGPPGEHPGDDDADDSTGIDTDADDDRTAPDEHLNNATMLDPLDSSADQAKNATYVDWIGGTLADAGPIPLVAPTPVTPGPPRTRMIEEQAPEPQEPPEHPGTRIMSGTMVSGLLGVAPMPEKPVEQIAPPKPAPMPKVAERFGIRFLSGIDDATELFDALRRKATASPPVPPPALLIVGDPHTGQRRLTRLIARTLAGAGVGDGSVRTADGAELRGDRATTVTAILRGGGPPLLFERLDRAILDAADPGRVVAAVTRSRANGTVLIATATPDSYTRLAGRYPELARAFEVFRLPDLGGVGSRLALLHVLADERRVTINASGLDVVRGDLGRLGGHGDLIGARLVEAYLDRAVSRHTEREGAPRDRMVLQPVDFAGVAEDIEPVLRPPRDVDGFLRGLDEMIGLDEVKRTVGGLVAEARMAADRATRGLPSGNSSRHLIFLGRPGTGKATVAGLIGGIYAALNLLDSGHLVVCGARDFAGGDTGGKVAAQVDRAAGGVLLIEDAYLLDRMSVAVDELSRLMAERRDKFMVVCASLPDEMEGFLLANPGFRAEFGAIVEFREPTERQLVGLFSRLAERDLYMLDEELRVELLDCFAGMRRYPGFAFADTVRRLFDQIVARQASRLTGAHVNPAAVARLGIRDLPDTEGERLLQQLHPNRLRRPPE
ncbi:MAG: hypothetical protein ACRDP6_17225 [Actinoallomurus sp.]